MSLVYNNKKLIGKCSKFAIEKVQGTCPFVMLENFEPKQPQLNENQQIVLDYLKTRFGKNSIFVKSIFDPISDLLSDVWIDDVDIAFEQLDLKQEIQVLEVFGQWALKQEEE
ncbi:hypothetical protein [Enterococcus sp.]|uniref:hypothetical protein n=1 Tax=Enterococcus sp. TaxID=35783 RepID=UPI0028A81905|nr:hypothetical protein [Enterococcus sp.]